MTSRPAYDYPEPYANPRQGAVALPRNISLVGRLRLTQPVWLQLGINSATALHILQREPAGTFLVRRSNTRQCHILCLRLLNDLSPAFVTTYRLHQERAAITLEGSDRSFPTLLHLVASYCSTPDVLPLALRLPQPIWEASTCQKLEAIAHLGLAPEACPRHQMHQFWKEHSRNSSLEEMMLDSGAQELTREDTPEILSLLPFLGGQEVLELGAGIGRFTGSLAESAHHVTAVDFMETFLNRNRQENSRRTNVTFLQADVTNLEFPSQSFDLIFSNWLFMYLSDEELSTLTRQMLLWLRPQGRIFFRESCFSQSGNTPRRFNPSFYRKPAEYNQLLTSAQVTVGKMSYGFEIVLSRSVQTYIKRKQNQNQICWLLQKVPRELKNTLGYETFQKFLDNEQYTARSIRRYEWVFGPTFVSTGGLKSTKELVRLLDLKPGQHVLDVGCGLGGSDFYLAKEFGVEVLGLDLSSNMVELALERAQREPSSLVQFEISDVTRRIFPQASFDVVYSRDTILHIEDKINLFRRFLLWLKPGGQLLISDYCCGPRPWSTVFTQYVEQRKYNLLTPEDYGQLLQEAGFVHVRALDSTDRMSIALTEELQALETSRERFLQEFSEEEFESMASGWREKLQRCAAGDQRWGVFLARKPQ